MAGEVAIHGSAGCHAMSDEAINTVVDRVSVIPYIRGGVPKVSGHRKNRI
jgi:hypothetical protein